jgi:hypothetical protein
MDLAEPRFAVVAPAAASRGMETSTWARLSHGRRDERASSPAAVQKNSLPSLRTGDREVPGLPEIP